MMLLKTEFGIDLPRHLQVDFAKHVQAHTDATGREITPAELRELFDSAYRAGGATTSGQRYESDKTGHRNR